MYNVIVNPITNRRVNITSRLGKNILKNYLNFINKLGGASASKPVGYGETAPSGSTCGICTDTEVTEQIWYSNDLENYGMYPWICKDCVTDEAFGIDEYGNKARECDIVYNSTGKNDIKNFIGKTKRERDLIPPNFTQSIKKYEYDDEREDSDCGAGFLIEQDNNQGCSRYAVDTFKGKKFMLDYSRNFKNKFIRNYTNKDLLNKFVYYIEKNNSKYGMRDFYIDYYNIGDADNINNAIIDNLIKSVQEFTGSGTTNDKNFWKCQYINVDYETNLETRQSKCISNDNCEFSDRTKNCNLKGVSADDYWADNIANKLDILYMILIIKDIDNTNGKVIFNPIKEWSSQNKLDPNITEIYLQNVVKPDEGDCVKDDADWGDLGHAIVIKKNVCAGNVVWLLLDSLAGGKQYDISDGKGQINVNAIETLTRGEDQPAIGIAGYGNTDIQQVTIKSLKY